LTAAPANAGENLCVMFLQDLREMEARLRTEKLAALGRMSTAVAHEIRNPLAAISQANELLEEDLLEPAHKRLSLMVRENAQRLGKIVDEVLDIARVKHELGGNSAARLPLDDAIRAMCNDWGQQTGHAQRLQLLLQAGELSVSFDPDHLRRVLINLLDNALRYAGAEIGAIRIHTSISPARRGILQVWSAGEPLEKTVQQHLFEPFFSSQSRSSGLGLYICRELCERHQAVISYRRARRDALDIHSDEGNEFSVAFRSERSPVAPVPASDWQATVAR
jgi:two-component system sensor histidine kinase PilS (NtrC family)